MSIAQIGERLGRAPATIKGYFYDPTREKPLAVEARYRAVAILRANDSEGSDA